MTPALTAARSLAVAVVGCVVGTACNAAAQHTAQPGRTTGSPMAATGVISGVVAVCAGPPARPPRPATVHVSRAGSVVTSAHVIAGEPRHDQYRVTVPPGTYVVEATNWPAVRHRVSVGADGAVRADFPNVCD